MLLLEIMLGLTALGVALLILNLKIFRKTKAERKRINAELDADKEMRFRKNCTVYGLSVREMEVLRLILAGHTYKSAAEKLFVSEKTVDAHLRRIYTKSGVKNKIELINTFYA